MKVLGICASPRKDGNTASMIARTLRGAAAKGAETELVYLYDLDFKGCRACMRCKTEGECKWEDDMQSLSRKVKESDAIVFGSPIYYGDITGVAKCFMERTLYPKSSRERQPLIDRRRSTVLLFSQNNPDLEAFRDAAERTKERFNRFGFEVKGTLTVQAKAAVEEVDPDSDAMRRAEELGKSL